MKARNLYLALALVAGSFAISAGSAWANTAANTRITNSADLSYNDGTGTKHATSQVTVSVALKPTAPTVTGLAAQTGPYPSGLTDDFVITNNSNGPDTFVLTAATGNVVNTTGATATPGAPVTVGATVTVSGSSTNGDTTTLIVPADGAADNAVNGIHLGDKIVINGEERTVTAIQDNASGTSILQVPALNSAAPGAGVVVGGRVTVHATAAPTNITAAGQNVSFDVTVKATSQADNSVFGTSGAVSNIFYSGSATLIKYVRNVSNSNGSGGSTTTLNTYTYFNNPTSLTAKPGDILEYLLIATDTSQSAPVTGVTLTDMIPVDYVSLVTNAYGGKAFRYYPDAAAAGTIDYTAQGGDDAVDYDPNAVTTLNAAKGKITAWIGGANPQYNNAGTIAAGKGIMLLYQVKVNP